MNTTRKDYHKYLQSDEWKAKRQALFALRGEYCEVCKSSSSLHIHHLTYKNIFNEPFEDLEILCEFCHFKRHQDKYQPKKLSGRIPTFNDIGFLYDLYINNRMHKTNILAPSNRAVDKLKRSGHVYRHNGFIYLTNLGIEFVEASELVGMDEEFEILLGA